jgi:hypothetical protein
VTGAISSDERRTSLLGYGTDILITCCTNYFNCQNVFMFSFGVSVVKLKVMCSIVVEWNTWSVGLLQVTTYRGKESTVSHNNLRKFNLLHVSARLQKSDRQAINTKVNCICVKTLSYFVVFCVKVWTCTSQNILCSHVVPFIFVTNLSVRLDSRMCAACRANSIILGCDYRIIKIAKNINCESRRCVILSILVTAVTSRCFLQRPALK